MNLANHVESFLDLKFFRQGFLILSISLLPLIVLDGVWLELKKMPASRGFSSHGIVDQLKVLESLSFYESVFEKDTLFGKVSRQTGIVVSRTPISDLVKDLRLKGVVLGGESEAILEDARTQKTNFVKVGQTLGELVVKAIKEGQIVLARMEEETTLTIQ